tara:strand:- start:324 stop:986 length:663 start_codon:yes stop_codon:yes gene_type:complete
MDSTLFQFLDKLKNNNNRDWFKKNKPEFDLLNSQVKSYFQSVFDQHKNTFDWDNVKVFRIYRDVRFSKNKAPYKTHFGIAFHRSKPNHRGGFYVHLDPSDSFIASGFWDPNKDDLFRMRKEIEMDHEYFRKKIEGSKVKKIWGEMKGEKLKTSPKGFDREHPANDLLQYKQYIFYKKVDHKTIFSQGFETFIIDHFKTLLPVLNYMGEVLNTNLDGESLL